MKNTLLAFTLSAFSALSFASSHISYLNVENDTVVFSLSDEKSHTIPSCVSSENQQKYAVSLTSETGRAVYSLLITAMASKQGIAVESANDCAVVSGIEQAMGVSIVPEVITTGSGKAMYLYKSDGVTKLGRILTTMSNTNNFLYFPVDDNTQILSYNNKNWLSFKPSYSLYFDSSGCTGTAYIQSAGANTPYYLKNAYFNNGGLLKKGAYTYVAPRSVLRKDGVCIDQSYGGTYHYSVSPFSGDICGDSPCIFKEE
ncbi:hypothetical protein tinsulaeT_20720 [Thalassotalea insulae]|uniref:Uncharacterized protein n=1 Tax=Thalassotalea insulae TaxID=2056778 RepID=A0ABQ6GS42_9GAMM|nr:hypothetical protein [Thalassotalea insulae]GLX78732.1 hypothetical protein tinsulaeT_20720 [Thalassotalea insulae]